MTNSPVQETTIHVLDESTVNKIAAGEVVERPASVVKELIENAVDADARTIRIEIHHVQGTIVRIQVTDDGFGMSEADAVMAFTSHATSKIQTLSDLEKCSSLGFRGEALASIAAVSAVTLITKPRGSSAVGGMQVKVRGGTITGMSEIGAPEGTTVIVEDLFYNTPARRKFQKSLAVELSHIASIVEGEALSHREIAFSLMFNKKRRLSTQSTPELADTIVNLYGVTVVKQLIPLRASGPCYEIEGYISQPELSRQNRDQMYISINNRHIRYTPIAKAVREGYGTLLPKDHSPVLFLNLCIDPALVDVNVHPTKREVRLSNEREILDSISNLIKSTLQEEARIPE
ncbi:MAG TPA: DNA mismatch repair endonuclease MutL, partial [Methanomicrobiales archaeon]|nr:DNA mismatch repair endonuclease MutL [Methanomicrobiales archaeon]